MSRELPRLAKGSRPRFYAADGVDELISVTLELAAEIATLRERQYVTERVLATKGLDITAAIEAFEAGEDDDERLAADRERLLASVFRALGSDSDDEDADAAADDGQRPRAA